VSNATISYQEYTQKRQQIDSNRAETMFDSTNSNALPFNLCWIRCSFDCPLWYPESERSGSRLWQIASSGIFNEAIRVTHWSQE